MSGKKVSLIDYGWQVAGLLTAVEVARLSRSAQRILLLPVKFEYDKLVIEDKGVISDSLLFDRYKYLILALLVRAVRLEMVLSLAFNSYRLFRLSMPAKELRLLKEKLMFRKLVRELKGDKFIQV